MVKRLKSILFDNLLIKLFSLLFAVLLWMYASTRGQSEINFVVPLEFRDVPAGMMVVGEPPRTIDVRLSGDEVTIRSLTSKEVGAFISLNGAHAGETLYNLTSKNIKAPANVTVSRVAPSEARIRLDTIVQKQLTVRPKVKGRPEKPFRVNEVKSDPETVLATGPKREVERLDEVVTEPVDVEGMVGGFERQAQLADPAGPDVSLDTNKVKVIVSIGKRGKR